jgi:ABC-type glutathione transport system ATPase component
MLLVDSPNMDEPTSALDVSVRVGIVNLLAGLRAELSLSYLFISHDVAVIRQLSDQIGVMYQGRFTKAGYTPDGSTQVEPEYEATEVRLVKVFS